MDKAIYISNFTKEALKLAIKEELITEEEVKGLDLNKLDKEILEDDSITSLLHPGIKEKIHNHTIKSKDKIKVKYLDNDMPKIEKIEQGDWIDLRVASVKEIIKPYKKAKEEPIKDDNKIYYQAGDTLTLGLGVAMELPAGKEAYMTARSSTFKKTGLLLTNAVGIIDNSYCGDEDEWLAVVHATRDGSIEKYQRLFQFRIQDNQDIELEEVKHLGNKNRGGYGSTGSK